MDKASEYATELLKRHEGERSKVYMCSEGVPTIGIGRNLRDKGLSQDEIQYLFTNDLCDSIDTCSQYPYWPNIGEARQAALIDMAFQLGARGLSGFKKMHEALQCGDWQTASIECLDSKYATQTPARAKEISNILLYGVISNAT